ncbi:MAG TPA: 2,3-bisphosphoglycerate-dependent phosphoglycerate mutase [Candidatus Binatia bacterium]|nr:2,3-bisphosphoglycerate-dependent phosphoglycerate mutase [Candidatus Binatia bacterium]
MSGGTLTLLRHGQSEWNRVGRFQGWTDVALTEAGAAQAERVGRMLLAHGYRFDSCSSSILRRSTDTARIVLETMSLGHVRVDESWRLNERHYGALQGLGPVRSVLRYGLRVLRCQRSFTCAPPALTRNDPRFPGNDPRYADLSPEELPMSESLQDTFERFVPYWHQNLVPQLRRGRSVLMVSHKNVLRGLLKLLDGRDDDDIKSIKVPTCVPIVFEFNHEMKVVGRRLLREPASQSGVPVPARG